MTQPHVDEDDNNNIMNMGATGAPQPIRRSKGGHRKRHELREDYNWKPPNVEKNLCWDLLLCLTRELWESWMYWAFIAKIIELEASSFGTTRWHSSEGRSKPPSKTMASAIQQDYRQVTQCACGYALRGQVRLALSRLPYITNFVDLDTLHNSF